MREHADASTLRSINKDMILKYFDSGFHCIPIQPKSKARLSLGGLSNLELSKNGITEAQALQWDKQYPLSKGYGLGILCGEASNVVGADVDSDDPALHALMPFTPCVKVGAKGATYFYRYEEKYSSKIYIRPQVFSGEKGSEQIELLTNGQYTILPPSIHKDTLKPYYWKSEELWLVSSTELPFLDDASVQKIHKYFAEKYNEESTDGFIDMSVDLHGGPFPQARENEKPRSAHGSHNRLKKLAANLLGLDTPILEAALSLLKYDVENHLGVPYFKDKTRGKDAQSSDPLQNAKNFYERIARSVNKKRLAEGLDPHSIIQESSYSGQGDALTSELSLDPYPIGEKQLPPITGAMKDFVDFLNKASISENTEVYLGAAIAWLSMLTASRFAVKTKAFTTPANLMLWGVMPSGVGKDSPQSLIQDLLYPHNVLGASSYKSAPSLLMNLRNVFKEKKGKSEPELLRKGQRENLIIIDECSSLFRIIAKGESYQQEIVETLNTLFSRSSGFFAGDQSVDRGMRYGAAYNPYFTLMGFTTYNHFKETAGAKIVGNGFFERSLVFIKTEKSKFNQDPQKDDELFKKLKDFTDKYLGTPVSLVDYGEFIEPEKEITTEVAYAEFPISKKAEEKLHEYRRAMYEVKTTSFDESFFNRFGELATKLSLLHAVSDARSEIEASDVEWGIALVEWCYARARPVFEQMSERDVYAHAVEKIREKLKDLPGQKATRINVVRSIRFEPPNTKRVAFLDELIKMRLVDCKDEKGVKWIKVINSQKRPPAGGAI